MTHFKHSIRLACTLALASLLPLGAGAQDAAPASSTQTDKGTQQMSNPHPRVKLETNPAQPVHIQTVHGVGYKFVP